MEEFNCDEVACDKGWASLEFESINVGDTRLDSRFFRVTEDLSARPQVPINHASEDWAATKAAYRLFSNPKIKSESILKVHQQRTRQRVAGEEIVLAIQDTSYLNYNDHNSCKGLGYIGTEQLKGVVLHTTLAVTPNGLPLGMLAQKKYTRLEVKGREGKDKEKLPIEKKESFRWIEALRETCQVVEEAKRVVTVCDREGDIYELLVEAQRLETRYVIRASSPRSIINEGTSHTVDLLQAQPACAAVEVRIPPRDGHKGRVAVLELRYASCVLRPPRRCGSERTIELKPLQVDLILASEIETPPGVEALCWVLLTNVKVSNVGDVIERLSWYKLRWHIEIYHKILKSGCKVEECRLETIERLFLYLTLFGIIAWRIFWLTHISRTDPNAPVETVLAASERQALSLLAGRKNKVPAKISTARQAVVEIAKLGGFLARRHDGHPGVTVIWRGWQRLSDATEMFEVMSTQTYG